MAHKQCTACRLCGVSSRMVWHAGGDPDGGIILIGEGPGPAEDASGDPFDPSTDAGRRLTNELGNIGLSRSQVYLTTVVKCFPNDGGQARPPADDEVTACTGKWLEPELKMLKPKVLVCVGEVAARAVLGRAELIAQLRGKVYSSPYCGVTIPVYDPAYLLRNRDAGERAGVIAQDNARDWQLIREMIQAHAPGLLAAAPAPAAAPATAAAVPETDWRAQLEQRLIEAKSFRTDRKYVLGYSDGPNPVFIYRKGTVQKCREKVEGFPWYFYMRTEDVVKIPPAFWRAWRQQGVVHGVELDDVNDAWTKVFAKREIVQTNYMKQRGEVGVFLNVIEQTAERHSGMGITSDKARRARDHAMAAETAIRQNNYEKFESDRQFNKFLVELHQYGYSYEADLTPRQRFMTDHFIVIEDHYNELFFDIETDDSVPGWEDKETWRFLSIAAVLKLIDGTVERRSFVIEREDDRAERRMLEQFAPMIAKADILLAWNGFNFDFPILRNRMRKHRITVDWQLCIWIDLLATWRRYHSRGASAITSFALGELAPKALGRDKLDWREESARRGKPVSRIIDLYRQHRDLLVQYNERDAELLFELEEKFGYSKVDRIFCRLGNTFTNDIHVSTKVDMLMLNKGKVSGNHFLTRGLQHAALPEYVKNQSSEATKSLGTGEAGDETEATTEGKKGRTSYTGAFVFEPVVGYHENVAALDFKSLYPTVMMLFNISPETWVPRDRIDRYDPAELTRTPSGAYFLKREMGLISRVFKETLEKRKVYTKLQLGEEIGSPQFLLYYRLSYAYKRLGLSFYGELGDATSRYFNPEVAEAVTLTGQWLIKNTSEFAAKRGFRTLAGDTDSLYIAMSQADAERFVKDCDAYYRQIVQPFNVDMDRFMVELEYENYFRNIVFVRKKRYAGKMTIFKGKESDYLEVKGLEMMRSDGSDYARRFQRKMLEHILGEGKPPITTVVKLILEARDEVFSGRLGVDDVSLTKSIEKGIEEYKTKPPHVRVAEHIRSTSTEYFVGMKVPYIVTREYPMTVIWSREYKGTYDVHHAWNKLVYPATERVLRATYPNHDWATYYVTHPESPKVRADRRRAEAAAKRAEKEAARRKRQEARATKALARDGKRADRAAERIINPAVRRKERLSA